MVDCSFNFIFFVIDACELVVGLATWRRVTNSGLEKLMFGATAISILIEQNSRIKTVAPQIAGLEQRHSVFEVNMDFSEGGRLTSKTCLTQSFVDARPTLGQEIFEYILGISQVLPNLNT